MYDRTPYTPSMREVIKLAKAEAGRLGCDWIGPEHYLLGIIRKPDSCAFLVLSRLGLNAATLKGCLEEAIGKQYGPNVNLFSPNAEAKMVLDASKSWAREVKHNWIGTEHLLVGIASCTNKAAFLLASWLGSNASDKIKHAVMAEIDGTVIADMQEKTMKLTGTNASLEITTESLKAQLKEQGFIVTEKPKPAPREVVWQKIEIEDNRPVQVWHHTGQTIPDELIQAYEELYQATLAIEDTVPIYTRKQGQFERFVKGRNSVNAIKSRTAGK